MTDPAGAPSPEPAGPVAISQDAMLWHEQFSPGSFNLPCLVRRYRGPLDTAALECALSELIRRHEPLRTTFELVDGTPWQVVGEPGTFALAVTDLADRPEEARDAEMTRLLADASSRPFDLVHGPLFVPRLVRLGTDDHVLVVRLHHTVFDDWSVEVFRKDFSALYASFLDGRSSPLPELATTFVDFARTERSVVAGEVGAAQLAWWRTHLAGAPLSVQLPIAAPDGAGRGRPPSGEPVRRDLPYELATRLRTLSRELRATPFMTALAAFAVLVARITGQLDLVMASVVAHRNRTELEPLIGCFTKKILVRLSLDDDPSFPELVARGRSSVLGAMAHQDPAFEAVVAETLGPAAAAHGVVPQIAVVFQGETPQPTKLVLPGIRTTGYDTPVDSRRERHFSAAAREDDQAEGDPSPAPVWGDGAYAGTFLILSLLANPDEMALVARGVFDRPVVAELLEHFEALLAAVVADPHRRVSEIAAAVPPPNVSPEVLPADDRVELRGFRARRSRIEAALERCPGVADVGVAVVDADDGPRLVAFVVADDDDRPTLSGLRAALWAELPGSLWPARLVTVDALHRRPDGTLDVEAMATTGEHGAEDPDPAATLLAGLWSEARGEPMSTTDIYWQDFSFLTALAEARQAGLALTDEQLTRCRTPEMLAVALAAQPAGPMRHAEP